MLLGSCVGLLWAESHQSMVLEAASLESQVATPHEHTAMHGSLIQDSVEHFPQ